MTMTRDEINELIKLVDNNQERIENVLHEDEDAAVMMIKQALTEYRDSLDRFDVLQHLRDGGKAYRGDLVIYWHHPSCNIRSYPSDVNVGSGIILHYDDWQPYEPPVETHLDNTDLASLLYINGKTYRLVEVNKDG